MILPGPIKESRWKIKPSENKLSLSRKGKESYRGRIQIDYWRRPWTQRLLQELRLLLRAAVEELLHRQQQQQQQLLLLLQDKLPFPIQVPQDLLLLLSPQDHPLEDKPRPLHLEEEAVLLILQVHLLIYWPLLRLQENTLPHPTNCWLITTSGLVSVVAVMLLEVVAPNPALCCKNYSNEKELFKKPYCK